MALLRDAWLARPRPNPRARLRLVCFPHAGVGPAIFRAWSDAFPADIEVSAVCLPGREGRLREAPFTDLTALVGAAADALGGVLGDSFVFFGHSLGALVAFELARERRRRRDAPPLHLFVAGRRAPHRPEPHPPIHRAPDAQFVAEVRRRYNGIPDEVLRHPDLLALLLPALRADFSLLETYVHARQAPLDCPITVLGGVEDPTTTAEDLAAWRAHTRAACTVRMLPGDHFFVQTARDRVVKAVADDLPSATSGVR